MIDEDRAILQHGPGHLERPPVPVVTQSDEDGAGEPLALPLDDDEHLRPGPLDVRDGDLGMPLADPRVHVDLHWTSRHPFRMPLV